MILNYLQFMFFSYLNFSSRFCLFILSIKLFYVNKSISIIHSNHQKVFNFSVGQNIFYMTLIFSIFPLFQQSSANVNSLPSGLNMFGGFPGLENIGLTSPNFLELQQQMQREVFYFYNFTNQKYGFAIIFKVCNTCICL